MEQELLKAFQAIDKNHDGYITRDELKQTMKENGQHISDEELNA